MTFLLGSDTCASLQSHRAKRPCMVCPNNRGHEGANWHWILNVFLITNPWSDKVQPFCWDKHTQLLQKYSRYPCGWVLEYILFSWQNNRRGEGERKGWKIWTTPSTMYMFQTANHVCHLESYHILSIVWRILKFALLALLFRKWILKATLKPPWGYIPHLNKFRSPLPKDDSYHVWLKSGHAFFLVTVDGLRTTGKKRLFVNHK